MVTFLTMMTQVSTADFGYDSIMQYQDSIPPSSDIGLTDMLQVQSDREQSWSLVLQQYAGFHLLLH